MRHLRGRLNVGRLPERHSGSPPWSTKTPGRVRPAVATRKRNGAAMARRGTRRIRTMRRIRAIQITRLFGAPFPSFGGKKRETGPPPPDPSAGPTPHGCLTIEYRQSCPLRTERAAHTVTLAPAKARTRARLRRAMRGEGKCPRRGLAQARVAIARERTGRELHGRAEDRCTASGAINPVPRREK